MGCTASTVVVDGFRTVLERNCSVYMCKEAAEPGAQSQAERALSRRESRVLPAPRVLKDRGPGVKRQHPPLVWPSGIHRSGPILRPVPAQVPRALLSDSHGSHTADRGRASNLCSACASTPFRWG
uniref:Uncharacterized protein n=1 Tax=Knipowitschia caucasica TaxID=637954 RepID=A0AAV2JWZ0_KNICA